MSAILKNFEIKNFNSIIDSGIVEITDSLFTIAGQNESGKSSFLEALQSYEDGVFDVETLNFLKEQNGEKIQHVSCTYLVDEVFWNLFQTEFKNEYELQDENIFNVKQIANKIKEIKITKEYDHDNNKLSINTNYTSFNIIKDNVLKIKNKKTDAEGNVISEDEEPVINIDSEVEMEKIAEILFSIMPRIILFNDFSDILPDKILISDLENNNKDAKGYNAVRNFEKLLSKDLISLAGSNQGQKTSQISSEVNTLSADFQKAWSQKIHGENEVKIKFDIANENIEGKAVNTVFFYIETKDNVLLPPRKRSKGMIWFVSAWLDLMARVKNDDDIKLVILYDEPGQHLHIKAHKDMLSVFNNLVKKGNQVLFSTHSPSLIDTDKLNSIGLVINDNKKGSYIEGIFSKLKTDNQQDALQPISEAMGMEPLKDFGLIKRNNVLVEGLSDFYYLTAMKNILNINDDFGIIPLLGIKGAKINNLLSLCVGYNLNWVCIFDGGDIPKDIKKEIQEKVFNDDSTETDKHVYLHKQKEIEDIFEKKDLRLVDSSIKLNDTRSNISIIGKDNKILFSKNFLTKVNNKEIKDSDLSKNCKQQFEEFFTFIKNNLLS